MVMIISFIVNLFNKIGYYFTKEGQMKLIINGEKKEFNDNLPLESVLEELGLTGKVMAAAVNMQIVKQDNWKNYKLNDGDKLELLDFVGGG